MNWKSYTIIYNSLIKPKKAKESIYMPDGCKCDGCRTQRHYDQVHTQNKLCGSGGCSNCQCNNNTQEFLKEVFTPQSVGRGYRLTLTDVGTPDGYSIEFSADITVFDFFNLYSEWFDGSIDLRYSEDQDDTV